MNTSKTKKKNHLNKKTERNNCNLKSNNVKKLLHLSRIYSKTDVTKKYLQLKFELHLLKTKIQKKHYEQCIDDQRENKRHERHYALASASTKLK